MTKKELRAYRAVRRRNLGISLDFVWDSLRTHLADAVKCCEAGGNEEWHARCVREYGHVIMALSVELHEVTSVDFPRKMESLRAEI